MRDTDALRGAGHDIDGTICAAAAPRPADRSSLRTAVSDLRVAMTCGVAPSPRVVETVPQVTGVPRDLDDDSDAAGKALGKLF